MIIKAIKSFAGLTLCLYAGQTAECNNETICKDLIQSGLAVQVDTKQTKDKVGDVIENKRNNSRTNKK